MNSTKFNNKLSKVERFKDYQANYIEETYVRFTLSTYVCIFRSKLQGHLKRKSVSDVTFIDKMSRQGDTPSNRNVFSGVNWITWIARVGVGDKISLKFLPARFLQILRAYSLKNFLIDIVKVDNDIPER